MEQHIFGERIKELRKENELKQTQLAKDLCVTSACVVKWEKGTRAPDLNMLIKVAKYFKVSADYLIKRLL